jgi:hypothetical protein
VADDANLERMGEALFNLSDSLRQTGFFSGQQKHIDRYEEVIRAWHALANAYERLAR